MTRNAQPRARRVSISAIAASALACAVLAACNPPADQMIGAERQGAVVGGPSEPGKAVGSMPKGTTSTVPPSSTAVPSTTGAPSTTAAPSTSAPGPTNEMQPSTTSTAARPPATVGPRTPAAPVADQGAPSTTAPPTTTPGSTAAPTTTPPTPPSTAGACPSGQCAQAAPAGWRQVFVDEFTTNVPVGSFPNAVSAKWNAYEDGWSDTSGKGRYMPSKVLSVQNGVLDYHIRTENGVRLVSAPVPKIPGSTDNGLMQGRYTMRFRSDTMPGYKLAALLWPTSDVWPRDGEIDFPEGDLGGGKVGAYTHYQGATVGSDQDAYEFDADWNKWHTAVIERTSSAVSYYFDGVLIGRTTTRLPATPMQWVLQAETTLSGLTPATTAGHFQIDWVTVDVPA